MINMMYCCAQFVLLRNLYGVHDLDYFFCNYMLKNYLDFF